MIFTLTVNSHEGQFGTDKDAEQAVIRELLAQAASKIGSLQVPTEAEPASLTLNRMDGAGSGVTIVVGSFAFGADSHAVAEANARAAAQAEAAASKASAAKPKASKAA